MIKRNKSHRLVFVLASALVVGVAASMIDCAVPNWVNVAESIAKVAVPIAGNIVSVIDPELGPWVQMVQQDFATLVKTLDDYKALPNATTLQAVQSAFAAVNGNVAQLLAAAQLKNPGTSSRVIALVGLLSQAVVEIAALIPQTQAQTMSVMVPHTAGRSKGWKANDFKAQYRMITQGDLRFQPIK